ncbi:hypothetical protein ES708_11957 [subsurface metagenome]
MAVILKFALFPSHSVTSVGWTVITVWALIIKLTTSVDKVPQLLVILQLYAPASAGATEFKTKFGVVSKGILNPSFCHW